MGAYVRLNAFLSQIFSYSKVALTHHTLKTGSKHAMSLNMDGSYKLPPEGDLSDDDQWST